VRLRRCNEPGGEITKIRVEDLRRHNREVYSGIAPHFAKTRETPWPDVLRFIDGALSGERPEGAEYDLMDLGCGNGRHAVYAMAAHGARVAGVDISVELLGIAGQRAAERSVRHLFFPLTGELDEIPAGDEGIGACICVAALHHLPTRPERVRCLEEIVRVLVPGGSALVTVWSLEAPRFAKVQERQERDGPDVEGGASGDTLVSWTREGDGEIFMRYYHLYSEGELEGELAEVSGASLEECVLDRENYFCRFVRSP
jgi:tRNA (uracil-5-)-methyltransferase TRM9